LLFRFEHFSLEYDSFCVFAFPGFVHSAFTFSHESLVARSSINSMEVPPGALISFVQKGLQYYEIEAHVHEVRFDFRSPPFQPIQSTSKPFVFFRMARRPSVMNLSLLSPHIHAGSRASGKFLILEWPQVRFLCNFNILWTIDEDSVWLLFFILFQWMLKMIMEIAKFLYSKSQFFGVTPMWYVFPFQ
jgi:hypothetical protein